MHYAHRYRGFQVFLLALPRFYVTFDSIFRYSISSEDFLKFEQTVKESRFLVCEVSRSNFMLTSLLRVSLFVEIRARSRYKNSDVVARLKTLKYQDTESKAKTRKKHRFSEFCVKLATHCEDLTRVFFSPLTL